MPHRVNKVILAQLETLEQAIAMATPMRYVDGVDGIYQSAHWSVSRCLHENDSHGAAIPFINRLDDHSAKLIKKQ